jgi:hypothetical protein
MRIKNVFFYLYCSDNRNGSADNLSGYRLDHLHLNPRRESKHLGDKKVYFMLIHIAIVFISIHILETHSNATL